MSRWAGLFICAILGLALLFCGLVIPAHLRALETSVVQKAGRHTSGLIAEGQAFLGQGNLGAAELLAQAAQQERLLESDALNRQVAQMAAQHPELETWGGGDYHLQPVFVRAAAPAKPTSEPVTDWLVHYTNRTVVLELLNASTRPAVKQLLGSRQLTNTVMFAPSQSSAGQALDTALGLAGLLVEEDRLGPDFSATLSRLNAQALGGGGSRDLERVLLDLMSLGQRLNWGQLQVFVSQVPDAETLRRLAHFVRTSGNQLPELFAAVALSGQPAAVADYLVTYSQTGLGDLGASLAYGRGGLNELLRRQQPLYSSGLRRQLGAVPVLAGFENSAAEQALRSPLAAIIVKWLLYLAGGFLLAAAMHFAWPQASELERPLQVRGFHLAREFLFALGFLLVVLLLSEPFLARESQKADVPFRLSLTTVAGPVAAVGTSAGAKIMNQVSLLTLLLFFVLQGLLYTASVVKLAEIRRQRVLPRVKIKLLENEDHLFDAGLYLGFVGTIVSLILVSLNIITFSLMAAYSSTSFGIVFVSFFKIFHLRPLRRRLLLEAEAQGAEPEVPAAARLVPSA
jgi:hypothetical protein